MALLRVWNELRRCRYVVCGQFVHENGVFGGGGIWMNVVVSGTMTNMPLQERFTHDFILFVS